MSLRSNISSMKRSVFHHQMKHWGKSWKWWWWWNTVSNAWYYFSNKMILEGEIGDAKMEQLFIWFPNMNYWWFRQEHWQISRLSCNWDKESVVVCWNVYSDFIIMKDNRNTKNSQLAKTFFWSVVLENKKNWVYSTALKCGTDSVTKASAFFPEKLMAFLY